MTGTRAVVTGGASGIGRSCAAMLRERGAHVITWDLDAAADVEVDVADPTAVRAAMERSVERLGGAPDRVVACAGVGHAHSLLDETPADWDRVLSVNVTGVWLTLQAAAAAMVDADQGGAMVVVTSISGSVADRDMGAYCVSKAAADMLIRVAAVEWGALGIRVNGVGPGVTRTPMLPAPERLPGWVEGLGERTALGRLGEADDIAVAVLGMLEMPWVTGQILHADGGLALHSPIDAFGQQQRARGPVSG